VPAAAFDIPATGWETLRLGGCQQREGVTVKSDYDAAWIIVSIAVIFFAFGAYMLAAASAGG